MHLFKSADEATRTGLDFMNLHGVALALLLVPAVAAAGLALGEVRIAGVRLGVGGVLFVGLAAGQLGFTVDSTILTFVREFGLVLFVYGIGISIGPGFFEAFKRNGLVLNSLALSIVLLGALLAVAIHHLVKIDLTVMLGLLAGATTNTPSLAASQQVLADLGAEADSVATTGKAYALAYPFGIIGILLSMLAVRAALRIDVKAEGAAFEKDRRGDHSAVEGIKIEIRNPAVIGCRVRDLDELEAMGVVLSRVLHDGQQHVISPDDTLALGDVVYAVGPRHRRGRLLRLLGPISHIDLKAMSSSDIHWERFVVTHTGALGKTLAELDLRRRFGAVVTRVNRADHELVADGHLSLQFGDILTVVGSPAAMKDIEPVVGNRSRALQETQLVPIFLGIALGILAGSVPIAIPGLPAAVKLGLAGGPLVVAILLARIGHLGPLVWYMPPAANHLLRDFGIALFLAAVGLKSGAGFLDLVFSGDGLMWMAAGAIITVVPLLAVALIGRALTHLNYLSLCGVLAGSMTDPPALVFAQRMSTSEAATLSYATVYPLVMVARVVAPQLIALLLWPG